MLIPLTVARSSKYAHETYKEYASLIADVARRVKEEHVYLSGREPTRLFQLDRSAYIDTMRQRTDADNTAPMARYLFESTIHKVDPIEYLWQLDQRHSRLVDILAGLERQRTAARETRYRRNKVYKDNLKESKALRAEENTRLKEEKQRREDHIKMARGGWEEKKEAERARP